MDIDPTARISTAATGTAKGITAMTAATAATAIIPAATAAGIMGTPRSVTENVGIDTAGFRTARACHKVSKIQYNHYGQPLRIGGLMCYDRHGRPYVVDGSRHATARR